MERPLVHRVSAMKGYSFYKRDYHRRVWTRQPRLNESVVDSERDDRGPYGRGLVIHVDKEDRRVLVKFFLPPEAHHPRWVLCYDRRWTSKSDTHWNASHLTLFDWSTPHYVDLNAQSEIASVDKSMTTQYFEFDDLRWSSHEGGLGAWITRSYHP